MKWSNKANKIIRKSSSKLICISSHSKCSGENAEI